MARTETAHQSAPAAWQSEDTYDRVKGLIYEEFGRPPGRPEVRPLYEQGGVGRWRVNFRLGVLIDSSFRVTARLTPDGLVKVETVRDGPGKN